jgi:hypothetical protein
MKKHAFVAFGGTDKTFECVLAGTLAAISMVETLLLLVIMRVAEKQNPGSRGNESREQPI